MKQDIINSIESLKNYTDSSLIAMQNAKVPGLYELKTEQRYSYDTHGKYHSVYKADNLLYLTENLPFNINSKKHSFVSNLKDAVDAKDIFPFLLFLNGRFIKWSEITIIKDCKYSYIMVDEYNEKKPDIKCILLPLNISYEEDCKTIVNAKFSFNKFGECIDEANEGQLYTNIYLNNEDIFFEEGRVKNLRHKIGLDYPKKVSKNNLFVFNDGLLDSKVVIEGLNVFTIVDKDPIQLANKFIYKAFYNKDANETKDNIALVQNKDYLVKELINEPIVPEYIKELNTPFDFRYKQHDSYSNNVSNSLDYIMKYNSGLMNNVFIERSNITSRIYKGSDINKLMDIKGYVKMSRKIKDTINNNVIIFVNGLLYKGYNALVYINKDFKFPVIDIKDSDIIEFLFFKNIDNRIYDLVLHSGGNDIYDVDATIDVENSELYTIDIREREFNIERKDSVNYQIPFKSEKLSKTSYKIIPDDNFYYDRTLSLVSKRQFRYACKIAKEDCIDIILPNDFRFCNKDNRFMIFVNGRKIDNSNFKVTTIKPTRPFDDLSVYVNIPVLKGQKLEVFYLPEFLEETYTAKNLDMSRKVIIDRNKIAYNLSKDLYFIFVNGRKMTTSDVCDINQNALLINSKDSVKNISIIKHIPDDEILSKLFKDNTDMLTNIINKIPPKELTELYKSTLQYMETEEDYKDKEIPMRSVMYNIVRKYWMRPYINNGTDFVFDFDSSYFDEKDSAGNIIIREEDANLSDKIK